MREIAWRSGSVSPDLDNSISRWNGSRLHVLVKFRNRIHDHASKPRVGRPILRPLGSPTTQGRNAHSNVLRCLSLPYVPYPVPPRIAPGTRNSSEDLFDSCDEAVFMTEW